MFRIASCLASRVRLASNRFLTNDSRLICSRSYAAKDGIELGIKYKTVLARAIYNDGLKALAAGVNAKELRAGIEMTTRFVSENLRSRARMVRTNEEIAQVGTIAANGDKEIGDLIAKAIKEVGNDGPIMIFDGKTPCVELEFFSGMKLNRGYMSSYFITNRKKQICVLENPLILLHEKKLSDFNILMNLLAVATKRRKPVLIVADGVEDDALSTLFARKLSDGMKVCAIKAPEFGETRNAYMQELAFRTNGKVITEKDYLKIKHPSVVFHQSHPFQLVLGHCRKIDHSLSWSRAYSTNGVKKISCNVNCSPKAHDETEERFVPSSFRNDGGASFVKQIKNPRCHTDKTARKYVSVIHRAIHIEGLKALRAGVDQAELQVGLRIAFEAVEEHLKCRARMVSSIEEIAQV